jgi:nitroreductase
VAAASAASNAAAMLLLRPRVADERPVNAAPWLELVEDARLAPSPHNTQPWRVAPRSANEAELYAPVERLLPVEDPDGRFLTAGTGIFLEALAIAAAARGLRLEYEPFFPDLGVEGAEPALVARLTLYSSAANGHFPVELLERRRTSRLPYDGRPAPEGALRELTAIAESFGHRAAFTSDPELVRFVLDLNALTVFDDLTEDDRRREIGDWTRRSDDEATRLGDGFSPSCLGFPPALIRLFFEHHRLCEPRLMRALLKRIYLRSMRGTRTVGWIAGPWRTPQEWLDAGRMLMRFWLALTAHGLYLQPFGSVITNPRSHARLAEQLSVDEDEGEVWLLLRLGFSAEPPRSARRPAAEVIA